MDLYDADKICNSYRFRGRSDVWNSFAFIGPVSDSAAVTTRTFLEEDVDDGVAIGGTVVACFVTASNVLKSGEHTKSIPPPIPFIPPPAPPLSCCNPCSTLNIRY